MSLSKKYQSYRDLLVWQSAMALAQQCYELTTDFPPTELYGLTSQIKRSATSVPANIAEGHGRELPKAFVQFLRISQGSLRELETHLLLSVRVGLADQEAVDGLLGTAEEVGKMLYGLMRSIEKD